MSEHLRISAAVLLAWCLLCLLVLWAQPAHAQDLRTELDALIKGQVDTVAQSVQTLPPASGKAAKPARVEVSLGELDPRLKLAPCDKVRAYLPEGTRLWGRAKVGMRCEQGPVRWNVFWPVQVKVWAPAVVAVVPIKPGQPISAADVRIGETDLASSASPAFQRVEDVVGRSVIRPMDPGESIRQDHLRQRRWFAAGDPVTVQVRGPGFAASAEGLAISHGDEGQCARIRFENGRIICGRPVAERMAEVLL